jgi:hypothetical protein
VHRQSPVPFVLFALVAGALFLGVAGTPGEEKPKDAPPNAKDAAKKSPEPRKDSKPTTDGKQKEPEKKPKETDPKKEGEGKPEEGASEEEMKPAEGDTKPVVPNMEAGKARAEAAKEILLGVLGKEDRATELSPLFAHSTEAYNALLKLSEAALSGDSSRLPGLAMMDRLRASRPQEWAEILTAYRTRYGAPAFPTGTPQPNVDDRVNGNTFGFGHDVVSGRVPYKGQTIPVLYYNTLTGSRVGYFPPIDIARDAKTGRCRVFVVDPETRFDATHPTTKRVLQSEDFLQAVLAGEIPRDKKFHFTVELVVHNHTDLAAAVRQALKRQLVEKVEYGPAAPRTAADATRDDVYPIDVSVAAFHEVGFFCASPGCEDIRFTRKARNPTLGAREDICAEAPAWFICQLFSSAGASFRAEFQFEAFRGELTEARVFEAARGNTAVTAKELGKGGLSTDDETQVGQDGKNRAKGEVKILVERDKVLRNVSNLGATSRTVIQGASPEVMNTLLGILHNHYKDMPSAAAREVGEFYSHTLGWKARMEESGYADRIHAAASRQEFTETDRKLLNEMFRAEGKSSQFALGLRVLAENLPLGLNVGGGNVRETTDGKVHFSDEFGRKFINALSTIAKGGHFPIPPSIDLVLVSEQDVRKQFDQVVAHSRPGGVRSYTVSSSFNSRAPSLDSPPVDGARTPSGEESQGQPKLRATAPSR